MNPLRWRKMTWLIILFSLGMLWWAGSISTLDPSTVAVRAVRGVLVYWVIGLAVLWFIRRRTRPPTRPCPACGTGVRAGRTSCPACQFDFAAVARRARDMGRAHI